ncbi:hypothetical protein GWI33_005803 [Rhynchophorus ferrugineus]|uniref:Uncharacterized protein n=1 Tax=Rhynchophorus ferrugineus TaxID=354439 RepID=A0A834IGT7_RHYFE|nr:hypothetical protein GWI33_005803 [Rhynchophorus ferrugineus]
MAEGSVEEDSGEMLGPSGAPLPLHAPSVPTNLSVKDEVETLVCKCPDAFKSAAIYLEDDQHQGSLKTAAMLEFVAITQDMVLDNHRKET